MASGDPLGDSGYTRGEKIRADAISDATITRLTATIAAAILNAQQVVSNFRKQRDIMRRSQRIARALHDKLKDYYWPHELEYLEDCCSPEDVETIEALTKRYAGRLKADIARLYKDKYHKIACSMPRYCTSASHKVIQDLMLERSKAMGNAMILGSNLAFAEHQALNDVNLDRRLQAIALGQGLVGQAASFMRAAGGGYADNMAILSASFNSALQATGYAATFGNNIDNHSQAMQMAGGSPSQPILRDGTSADNLNAFGRAGITMPNPLDAQNPTMASTNSMTEAVSSAFNYTDPINTNSNGLMQNNAFEMAAFDSIKAPTVSSFIGSESEKKNPGRVGNNSLARYGIMTYTDFDSKGKPINITVNMEDFALMYSDGDSAKRGRF